MMHLPLLKIVFQFEWLSNGMVLNCFVMVLIQLWDLTEIITRMLIQTCQCLFYKLVGFHQLAIYLMGWYSTAL